MTSRGVVKTAARRRKRAGRQLGPALPFWMHAPIEFHSACVGGGMSWVTRHVLAAGLDLRGDLGDLALLVHGEQAQRAGDFVDAVEPGDLRDLGVGERELRRGEKQLALEGRTGLAELREVGLEERLVLVDQRVDLAVGQPAHDRRALPATGERHLDGP